MPLPKAVNRHLTGEFESGMCSSLFSNCGELCFAYCCLSCAVYVQRQKILKITNEPYVCCGGLFPFLGCDKPREEACLFAEAWCCPMTAIAANRFYVQTRFNKRNTGLDDCLRIFHGCIHIEFAICLKPICGCTREQESLCKAGAVPCICHHCQNAIEIEAMEFASRGDPLIGGGYKVPPTAVIEELPDHFANVGIRLAVAPIQQTM